MILSVKRVKGFHLSKVNEKNDQCGSAESVPREFQRVPENTAIASATAADRIAAVTKAYNIIHLITFSRQHLFTNTLTSENALTVF